MPLLASTFSRHRALHWAILIAAVVHFLAPYCCNQNQMSILALTCQAGDNSQLTPISSSFETLGLHEEELPEHGSDFAENADQGMVMRSPSLAALTVQTPAQVFKQVTAPPQRNWLDHVRPFPTAPPTSFS
jgi:hypothetical protein